MRKIRRATLDLAGCKTLYDLHTRIRDSLDFPDYYGKNWDAFWDCLSVDCKYNFVTVKGESKVSDILKRDVEIMNGILEENKQYWAHIEDYFDYEIID